MVQTQQNSREELKNQRIKRSSITQKKVFIELKVKNPHPDKEHISRKVRFLIPDGMLEELMKIKDEKQLHFFLKNLILTSPGENISDPEYGVGLRRFLFEPNIASVHGDISAEISSQISTYLPYLSVEQVSVSASPQDIDSNSINILISLLFELKIEANSSFWVLAKLKPSTIKSLIKGFSGFFVNILQSILISGPPFSGITFELTIV